MTAPAHGPTPEQIRKDKESRRFRKARRKVREEAGEIKELNITAMMDMMTIILVFLLKSYSASAINVNMGANLTIPSSSTQLNPQENITVTVATDEVSVNDRVVIRKGEMRGGIIPAAFKEGGKAEAFYIGAIYDGLKKEVDKQKYIAQYNRNAPFTGRVNVVVDRNVPYRTLMEILYTAGQAELGEYKFMVLKKE